MGRVTCSSARSSGGGEISVAVGVLERADGDRVEGGGELARQESKAFPGLGISMSVAAGGADTPPSLTTSSLYTTLTTENGPHPGPCQAATTKRLLVGVMRVCAA